MWSIRWQSAMIELTRDGNEMCKHFSSVKHHCFLLRFYYGIFLIFLFEFMLSLSRMYQWQWYCNGFPKIIHNKQISLTNTFQSIFKFPRNNNNHIHTYRVKLFGMVYGVVCILCMVGGGKMKKKTEYKHIRKKNLVALLLESLTICYYENQNIDCVCACAINTRPFTSFHLHESAFDYERACNRAKESTHTHTHMTISEFAHINCKGMLILLTRDEDMVYTILWHNVKWNWGESLLAL